MVGTLTGKTRHILLAGGGHAHAVALRQLAKQPRGPSLKLTLVAPSTHNLYSGALPGVIAGHWTADAIGVPLLPLCDAAGVTFVQDRITSIDPEARTAQLESGKSISFDLASLDVGSGIRTLDASDTEGRIIAIRPIGPFLQKWKQTIDDIKAGNAPPSIVVVGGGLAGIEVALAIQYRLKQEGLSNAKVHLVDAGERLASSSANGLRRHLANALKRESIGFQLATRLISADSGRAVLSTGEVLDCALIVNCAGSSAHAWLEASDLKTVGGRVEVDSSLRSTSHPHIWAAGDTSHFKAKPLEPAGVFAVRAGPVIGENIRRWGRDEPLTEFHPQSDYLKLVSLGKKRAVAEKFGIAIQGGWVWNLKKSIDFSFLREHTLTTGS